jgi:hypothetical protein
VVPITSSEQRETLRRRSSFARKPRPLFRADKFQSWDGRQLARRSAVCPQNRLVFRRTTLEYFDFLFMKANLQEPLMTVYSELTQKFQQVELVPDLVSDLVLVSDLEVPELEKS